MNRRRTAAGLVSVVLGVLLPALGAQSRLAPVAPGDLKAWLSYLASDELEGRATYSAGLGLAAGYIQERLREWNVRPAGDSGTYLQTVRVRGVRATSRSSVTVKVGNDVRTFRDGEGVTFARNAGGARQLTVERVEFAGYGLDAPDADHMDFRDREVSGAAVVWMGTNGPRTVDSQTYRRVLTGRSRYAIEYLKAAASISPAASPGPSRPSTPSSGASAQTPEFTTSQRLDHPIPPAITAGDEFFTFLFSGAPTRYQELQRRAGERESLPAFRLKGVSLTFNIDVDYRVVRTQVTQNVVGIVEGSDARLKDSYVAFGAHYDHVGFGESELSDDGSRRTGAPGRITPGAAADRVWNGADDDGSGTVALMAIAKAFAEGPRPRRSLLFVWHAGEERGLLGSRYFADHPTVPIESIVTHLNMDMIGRNRDDRASEANTVYLVGSDRISSELHEISRAANVSLKRPLTLDYEMNDVSDVEQVYYRSDHFSYASKGIPIIFYTTGLHADYHANTDEVSKIEFDKLARVTELVRETGWRVANLDHAPARDNRGPRAGKHTK